MIRSVLLFGRINPSDRYAFSTFFNGIALMNKTPVRRENNRLALFWFEITVDKRRLTTFKVVRQIQYNRYFPVIFLSTSNSPLEGRGVVKRETSIIEPREVHLLYA